MKQVVIHQAINKSILKTSVVDIGTGEIYGQEMLIWSSSYFASIIEATIEDAIKYATKEGYEVIDIDSPYKAIIEGRVL